MTEPIETGEELVQLIQECLADTGALQQLPTEQLEEMRHARQHRFLSRSRIAARLVQNERLPIYHRGLAARLLACTLSRSPGICPLSNVPLLSEAVLDTMNKASSGKSYAGALPLTPVDGHRVGINCAAALSQIHDPGVKSSHHVLDLEDARMAMEPYPE